MRNLSPEILRDGLSHVRQRCAYADIASPLLRG